MSASTTDSVNNNRLGSFYNSGQSNPTKNQPSSNKEINSDFSLIGITKNEQNAKDIAALKSNLEITQSDLKSKIKENEQNAKDIAALKSNLKSKIKENQYLEEKVFQITDAIFKVSKQNPSLSLLSDSLPELEIQDCSAYSNLDFSHLSKLTRLRTLTLNNCVNDACDENFIKHVKDLPITYLEIQGIKGFSDVGVTALPRKLDVINIRPRENTTFTNMGDFPNSLRHMVIFDCVNLKKEHIIKMSESLTQLTMINFAGSTCIKNDFLPHFPTTLHELYLSSCGIKEGEIMLDSLKELNTIGVTGWECSAEKIVEALPKSKSVKTIVEDNDEKREAFKQAIGDSNISVVGYS